MRHYIYSVIDTKTNSYDYDNMMMTTDDIEQAYQFIRDGYEQVAILDACDLSYLGYLDFDDLYNYEMNKISDDF